MLIANIGGQVYTHDSCRHWKEEGRRGSKKQKFNSCFFTLQTITEFYWGKRTEEIVTEFVFAVPLSIYPQIFHFLGFLNLTAQQSVGN